MTEHNDGIKTIEMTIPETVSGERLDKYLGQCEELDITRSRVQKLIDEGYIAVNGRSAQHNQKLKGGEKVTIKVPPPPKTDIVPENIPIDVIYEDDYMLVINKPAGMVTHPATGHFSGTLVNAVLHYSKSLSNLQGIERAGVVHRLDKNTSGLIMIAKNDKVHLALQKQLKDQAIEKIYYALVCGHMKEEKGSIDLPIGRSLKDRKMMAVTHHKSRTARTEYELLERYNLYDLLKVHLKTGRTHQIRVHFTHLGHPVFGDPEYGGRIKWHRGIFSIDKAFAKEALSMMPRQALHAKSLELAHPVTGENLFIDSELPDDFAGLLEFIKGA